MNDVSAQLLVALQELLARFLELVPDAECESVVREAREAIAAADETDPTKQQIDNCTLLYDLTAHMIRVTDNDRGGALLFLAQPLPDNPGGFDLRTDGHSIAVHNPAGVDFVGVQDMYEDNQKYEEGNQ